MDDLEWTPPGPGPWMQDRAHLPSSVTAMLQATYGRSFEQGFREAMAEYGALLDTLRMEFVNGFPYHQLVPFDAPGPDGPKSEEYIASRCCASSRALRPCAVGPSQPAAAQNAPQATATESRRFMLFS